MYIDFSVFILYILEEGGNMFLGLCFDAVCLLIYFTLFEGLWTLTDEEAYGVGVPF